MRQDIPDVSALRSALHRLAEVSGEEKQTKQALMEYLREHTTLRLEDHGAWFCALHEEPGAKETVAFRADMDALPFGEGATHLCGHDGHSAALAGLGLWLEKKMLGRNILLIFQHAEETGQGGKICCAALEEHHTARVYAFHNIPGYPEGALLLCRGTFACASQGLTVTFNGAPTHAAYPENGRNPGFAAARLIAALPALTEPGRYRGLTMATLIGSQIGTKAFGSAAGSAEGWLTLRAWHEADMGALLTTIKEKALAEAEQDGVGVDFSSCDVFPATANDGKTLEKLAGICREAGLETLDIPEPFRWSEDFGYYGEKAKAVMVGIGAGERWPQLHTQDYEFNDRLLPTAVRFFAALAEKG